MPTRSPVSKEFLQRNTCERVITGTARVVADRGYQAATVADIVKACGTARNTFYECFGGKEEAALAMVAALELDIEQLSEAPSLDVLLIEVAAMHHAREFDRAAAFLSVAGETIRFFAEGELLKPALSADDPREGTLPPGRHGLPPEFIVANQRARLLSGVIAAIVKRGWLATRIDDIAESAAVSRRTFYEQYGDLEALARAMVEEFLPTKRLEGLDCRSGLFAVSVEVVAERLGDGDPWTSLLATKALRALSTLTTAFGGVPA